MQDRKICTGPEVDGPAEEISQDIIILMTAKTCNKLLLLSRSAAVADEWLL